MNESIDYILNPDKYHTVPARNVGECDEQYKKRLKAYSIGFEKGAASRQAEVDELQEKVNREREEATEYFTDLEYSNAKCKELQKRIDEALELLNASSEHRTQVPVGRLFWILKGK